MRDLPLNPSTAARPVCLFGGFLPKPERLGPHTTGFSLLLSRVPSVSNVTVFCPRSSVLPPAFHVESVRLVRSWGFDDTFSIARTGLLMAKESRSASFSIFNIYPTSFGRGRIVNAMGMLIPVLVRFLARRKPCVYLHNSVASQDLASLGYGKRTRSATIARFLEKILLRFTCVLVPLQTQAEAMSKSYGIRPQVFFLPYLEGISAAVQSEPIADHCERTRPQTVLLFGFWGPQKDLEFALKTLVAAVSLRLDFKVKIAGEINTNFPELSASLYSLIRELPADRFEYIPAVADTEIPQLFASSSVVVLPYNAAGGTSGVLQLAALYGVPVVAYDLAELRETTKVIGATVRFVTPRNAEEFTTAIFDFLDYGPPLQHGQIGLSAKIDLAQNAVTEFLHRYCGAY